MFNIVISSRTIWSIQFESIIMPIVEIQLLISAAGIILSGVGGYMGIKVALAEVRKDIAANKENHEKLEERVTRLERPYFEMKR